MSVDRGTALPRVLLLATGDVIAYRPRSAELASAAELLATLPPDQPAEVVAEDVLRQPSWDATPAGMLALARRVRSALGEEGFAGVVVAHGLDTLEESAFLADLLAGAAAERGAIVFTGATRSLDEFDTDGPANLAASIVAASDGRLRGAGATVCLDGQVHAARWLTVRDVAGPPAGSSWPFPALGTVLDGRFRPSGTVAPRLPGPTGEPELDVALIKTYPGMDAVLLTAIVDAGARGVVLEGTGDGNVPVELFATISDLTEWDIPVVVASRCRTRFADQADRPAFAFLADKVGAISARGLAPAKAYVALMVALGGGGGVPAVRNWFDRL